MASPEQPNSYAIREATFASFRNFQGDPEVVDDLGMPVDLAAAKAQEESGRLVAERILAAQVQQAAAPSVVSPRAMTAPGAAEHAADIEKLGQPQAYDNGTEYTH